VQLGPQATHHPCHRPVWAESADSSKVLIDSIPRGNKAERQQVEDKLARTERVVSEIDAAYGPAGHEGTAMARLTSDERERNKEAVKAAMDQLLSGDLPSGGKCDLKTLAPRPGSASPLFTRSRIATAPPAPAPINI